MFGNEIVKDLTLFFVGRFRQSFVEQFQVLVVEKLIHGRFPSIGREHDLSQSPETAKGGTVMN
jgi:hypothetical protein